MVFMLRMRMLKMEKNNLEFRKIYALIPIELFLRLRDKGLLNSHFDEFVCKAISRALEEENYDW